MPHYKCAACKARLHVSGSPAEQVASRCPECGSLLEPLADLAELVGFRLITPIGTAEDVAPTEPRPPIAGRVDEFVRRRAGMLERDRFAAERWLDDGDERRAGAVALPPPETFL
jgi:hypothetical protein